MALRLASAGPDRYRLGQNSDINVTPFVDVMLVLLIIFMVAIPAAVTSVPLELPQAQAGDSVRAPTPTYVSLQGDGGLYVGEVPTTLAALPGDLATVATPRDRIYIRADRQVRYESFMAVMNALRAHGYERVGLVSEEL